MKQKIGIINEINRILNSFNYTFQPLNPLGEPFLKNDSAMVTTGGLGAFIEDCIVNKLQSPYIRSIDKSNKSPYDFCNKKQNVFVNIKTTNTHTHSPIVAGKALKELYNKTDNKKIYIIIHIPYKIDETNGTAIIDKNDLLCYTLDSVIYTSIQMNGFVKSDSRNWGKEGKLSGRILPTPHQYMNVIDTIQYFPQSFDEINTIIKNLEKYLKKVIK